MSTEIELREYHDLKLRKNDSLPMINYLFSKSELDE